MMGTAGELISSILLINFIYLFICKSSYAYLNLTSEQEDGGRIIMSWVLVSGTIGS